MSLEIRYSSRRSEVWNWYWQSWRKSLWRFHLGFAAAIVAAFFVLRGASPPIVWLTQGVGASALLIGALIAWPQLMFKPQERVLAVDEEGVRSTVGRQTGSTPWGEMSAVSEDQGCVVLSTRAGAYIVPPRAFGSEEARTDFLAFVRDAQARAAGA
ncbi:MAG: YcxB family protein [Caulobacteraceae bacterium]